MAAPPLVVADLTRRDRSVLPISSVLAFAELLRAEGGVLRRSQARPEWWMEGWLVNDRYPKCTEKGWDAICDALVYAHTKLGGIPVIYPDGTEKLRGTEQSEW